MTMPDREKVIKGLEVVRNAIVDGYIHEPDRAVNAITDALALLKEQEPKTILGIADSIEGIEVGKCPRCERTILNKQSDPTWYCKHCGQAVKWE